MAVAALSDRELLERLAVDTPWWAEKTGVLIVPKAGGERVVLDPRPAQLRFDAVLEEQREAGRPMRAIVLKARQLGFSTWTQAKIVQRVTQLANHKALTVAQDTTTAANLFGMAYGMYGSLPGDSLVKPPVQHYRRRNELALGEPSRAERDKGNFGHNSSMLVDTANEFQAGRGFTYQSMHCSEVALWADPQLKLTSLLNTIPDEPGTLIVLESTARGHNHFKTLWDQAEAGESDFAPFFSGWHEEASYARPFLSGEDRERFIETVGTGDFGEEEPELIELFGCSPEQLAWRRWCIANQCQRDLEVFHQEYPSNPEQAFVASGRQVFSGIMVNRVLAQTREAGEDYETGVLKATGQRTARSRHGPAVVPVGFEWEQRNPRLLEMDPVWKVWEHPPGKDDPAQHYVLAVDPASGQEADDRGNAYHAIEVINHQTKRQAAEWVSKVDPDIVAVQAFLAAQYWCRGWLVIETTGGYGLSIVRKVWHEFKYPKTYRRRRLEDQDEKEEERLGWDTNRSTKPLLEDGMRELLREGTHGIRSHELAKELTWYVQHSNGRTGPEAGKHSDRLMAYMVGQQAALEKPVPTHSGRVDTSTGRLRNPITGW